jgi:hypothetical protein
MAYSGECPEETAGLGNINLLITFLADRVESDFFLAGKPAAEHYDSINCFWG